MQALIELVAGFIAMLAAVALAQFGVDLQSPTRAHHEVRRVVECDDVPPASTPTVAVESRSC